MGAENKPHLEEFASTTTIHGVPSLLGTKSTAGTVVWGLILLTSLGWLIFMTYKAAVEFAGNPTTLEWSIKPLDEFPMITVYAQNVINASKVESLGLTRLHMKYLLALQPDWAPTEKDAAEVESNLAKLQEEIYQVGRVHNLSIFELLQYVKYDWKALAYVRDQFMNSTKLDESNVGFLGMTMTKKLRSGDRSYAIQPRFSFVIQNLTRDPPYIENESLRKTSYNLIIGGFSPMYESSVIVPPNTRNTIVLNPEKIHFVNRPNDPCRMVADGSSQDTCSNDCVGKLVECKFNCTLWSKDLEQTKSGFCTQHPEPTVESNISSTDPCSEAYIGCMKGCDVRPCRLWRYHEKISYVGTLNENEDKCTNCTNIFIVYLREGWRVTQFEERYVYSWSSFISNVGGLMGVCFGASLISVIHLCFHFIFKLCPK